MPSVLAHYILLKESDPNLNPISQIGAQGPDPFFFNVVSLKNDEKNKKITSLGHFLHNIDPMITFKYCIEYIKKAPENEKPILLDYFKGMMCHYALDSCAHPYIFYLSGFVTDDESKGNDFFFSHASIESCIDARCREHYGYKITSPGALKFKKKDAKIVSKMLSSYFNDIWKYDYVDEKSFYKAVCRFRFAYKVIYSHTGFKKFIYSHMIPNSLPNVLSVPKLKNIPPLDFMNDNHNTFVNCETGENPRTCTFYDLMDDAKEKYFKLVEIMNGILDGTSSYEEMAKITNNIDHDGKTVGSKMKYYDLIWDKLEKTSK